MTHASITALELQFAQNPRSDAYIALCEAYLSQGRYMEAMVVSKKGIKAHPEAVEAKLLLSRVYTAQRKFPRALQTLAAAIAAHPNEPRVYSLRARVKLSSGDQAGAIQDLKRAIDLDPNHRDALVQLDALGIAPPNTTDLSTGDVDQEVEVPPGVASQYSRDRSQPGWSPSNELDTVKTSVRAMTADLIYPTADLTGDMATGDMATGDMQAVGEFPGGDVFTPNSGVFTLPPEDPPSFTFNETPGERLTFGDPGEPAPENATGGFTFSDVPRNEFDFAGTFGEDVAPARFQDPPSAPAPVEPDPATADLGGPPSGAYTTSSMALRAPIQVAPQRLEGEEELERLAQEVATQKESRGRPRTTIALALILVAAGVGFVVHRSMTNARLERVAALTQEAQPYFDRDTYAGYREAAEKFERIIAEEDSEHPATLAKLAHTYAILWSEHGEPVKPRLDMVLARAQVRAADQPHTVAAVGLTALNSGNNHRQDALTARGAVRAWVERSGQKEGGPRLTHADLALSVIEIDLGHYDDAERRLRALIRDGLPRSVRARFWHGQAAYRAGRLRTALRSFKSVSKDPSKPEHARAVVGEALVFIELGDVEAATEALQKLDALHQSRPDAVSTRDSALALYARSAILRANGKDEQANGLLEEALRADPQNSDFLFGKGRWLRRNDRALEALVPLERAVAIEPTRWNYYVEIAEAEMAVDQWDQAKVNLDEAFALAPDEVEVVLARARLMRRRRRPGAEDYLNGLLENHPSAKLQINLELGRLYLDQRKYRQAELAFEAARTEAEQNAERYPRALRAEVYVDLGEMQLRRRRSAPALESFRKAAELGAKAGYFRVASTLYAGGAEAKAEAKNACSRLQAAGPGGVFAKKARPYCARL